MTAQKPTRPLASTKRVASAPGSTARSTAHAARRPCAARRWSAAIVGRLGRPAERVGVFGSRSEVSYTAALAALYSGAAFVPLNPRFPADRTRAMIRQAELDAIFVDKLASTHLAAVLNGLEKIPPIWLPETESAAELASVRPLDGELPSLPPARVAIELGEADDVGCCDAATDEADPVVPLEFELFLEGGELAPRSEVVGGEVRVVGVDDFGSAGYQEA